jgi:hypothetical protein
MDAKRFEELRAEWEADIMCAVSMLGNFTEKWRPRGEEMRTLSPQQASEMQSIAERMDKALEAMQ